MLREALELNKVYMCSEERWRVFIKGKQTIDMETIGRTHACFLGELCSSVELKASVKLEILVVQIHTYKFIPLSHQ